MKLVIISPYPPATGGLSVYANRMVTALQKQFPEIDTLVFPINNFGDCLRLIQLGTLKADWARLEFNIPAYGLGLFALIPNLLLIKLTTDTKLVVNCHEVSRETQMLGVFGKIFYWLFSKIFTRVFVHTQEAKIILTTQCGVVVDKVDVIPLGTMSLTSKKSKEELDKYFDLKPRKYILSFGFIHPDKGLEYLLQAIAIIKREHFALLHESLVVIAGEVRTRAGLFKLFARRDRLYKRHLIDLANRLGIASNVKFVGYVPEEYLSPLLKSASVVVLPYTKVEQSGVLNVVLPLGIPIVASRIGGLEETLATTGILVAPKSAKEIAKQIVRLLTDKAFYRKTQASYHKLAKEIDITVVNRMFIESLIG